jgi:hypothetical protein
MSDTALRRGGRLRRTTAAVFFRLGGGVQTLQWPESRCPRPRAVKDLRRFDLPLEYRSLDTENALSDYMACCYPQKGPQPTLPLRSYIETTTSKPERGPWPSTVTAHVRFRACANRRTVFPNSGGRRCPGHGRHGNIFRYTSKTSDLTGVRPTHGPALRPASGGYEYVQFYPYRVVLSLPQMRTSSRNFRSTGASTATGVASA